MSIDKLPEDLQDFYMKQQTEVYSYIKENDVGFYVKDSQTKFIRTKRHWLNKSWDLKYDDITGIACANVMRFDDDSFFLIIIRGRKKPIYFNITNGEEMQGFNQFIGKIKEKIGFESIWEQDKIIIAYPESLRGKELYYGWLDTVRSSLHGFLEFFFIKHHVSGIVRDEHREILKMK